MENHKICPYCKQKMSASTNFEEWERHVNSLGCRVEIEINSDPILRTNLRERAIDYNKMDHQIGIMIASFKIALHRALEYKHPTPSVKSKWPDVEFDYYELSSKTVTDVFSDQYDTRMKEKRNREPHSPLN